jgi:hypothetical protein
MSRKLKNHALKMIHFIRPDCLLMVFNLKSDYMVEFMIQITCSIVSDSEGSTTNKEGS